MKDNVLSYYKAQFKWNILTAQALIKNLFNHLIKNLQNYLAPAQIFTSTTKQAFIYSKRQAEVTW